MSGNQNQLPQSMSMRSLYFGSKRHSRVNRVALVGFPLAGLALVSVLSCLKLTDLAPQYEWATILGLGTLLVLPVLLPALLWPFLWLACRAEQREQARETELRKHESKDQRRDRIWKRRLNRVFVKNQMPWFILVPLMVVMLYAMALSMLLRWRWPDAPVEEGPTVALIAVSSGLVFVVAAFTVYLLRTRCLLALLTRRKGRALACQYLLAWVREQDLPGSLKRWELHLCGFSNEEVASWTAEQQSTTGARGPRRSEH